MLFSHLARLGQRIPKTNQISMLVRMILVLLLCGFVGARFEQPAYALELKAGFASVDISTDEEIPMGGYGTFFLKEPRMSIGVHDPLYASAMVIESGEGQIAALVSVDAVGLSGVQVARIESILKKRVSPELHLIVASTHTHHSPDTLGLWGSLPRSGRNSAYMKQLEAKVSDAVVTAFESRVAARLFRKKGRHENSTSASNVMADIQDEFVTLLFRASDGGELLGTLTQWAAHPTVLGMENNALSADFVGSFREVLRRQVPVPHLYFNGAIGKVYPIIPDDNDPALVDDLFGEGFQDPDVRDQYRKVTTVGVRLAQSVLETPEREVTHGDSKAFSMCHSQIQFPVDNLLFKIASQLNVVETRIRLSRLRSRISSLSVADMVFISVPGEIFPRLLNKIPRDFFGGKTPVFLGMGQDWLGYFVEPSDYDNDELKYWTGLSVHKNASQVLLQSMAKSIRGQDCSTGL
ncbi:MAG: hypothetical protein RJB13_493 [Pseudomonadota bacterium]